MIHVVLVLTLLLVLSVLTFSKKLRSSSEWKAMVTPLASIMGSGFLVSAPLLSGIVGYYAVFCMALLLVVAYFVGSAIRYNIQYYEPIQGVLGYPQEIAFVSRIILAAAYFISITYYLQLMSAFILAYVGVQNDLVGNILTTVVLTIIGTIGIWKGLDSLEKVEKFAIHLNLSMIAALIVALAWYNASLFFSGGWSLPDLEPVFDFNSFRVVLGLLIVVQGFETSRYLGASHSAQERISSMKKAQILAAVIYVLFLGLVTVLFEKNLGTDVTAIITIITPVSFLLPVLVALTAISSQFSASVADTAGAGGLVSEISHQRVKLKCAYFIILFLTIVLTWETNITEIIAYASRAFALYYSLQCMVSFLVAIKNKESLSLKVKFLGLSLICMLVFLLGLPAE